MSAIGMLKIIRCSSRPTARAEPLLPLCSCPAFEDLVAVLAYAGSELRTAIFVADIREIGKVRAVLVRCNICSLPLGIHREVDPPAEAVVFLVFPCFLGREHRAAGHTGCIELIISFFGIVKSVDPVGDDLLYKGMVLAAVRHRHKARIFLVFGMPHAVAKCVPRCGRYCADDHGHGLPV